MNLMVKKSLLALCFLGIYSGTSFAQEWKWEPFSPEDQPWTILAPGPMKPDTEAQKRGSNKGTYAYNDFNGFFAVIYRDSPRRWVPWKPDYNAYIENVRDDVVSANRGELLKETKFSNRGAVGLEAFVKFQTGTTRGMEGQRIPKYRVQRFRMFFIGRRFYVVLAVVNESEIESPAINRYFDSFAVNSPPEAVANSYSVNEDADLTVNAAGGVLANDEDAEGNRLTISPAAPVEQPKHGLLTLNADGSFSYKPEANFNGTDTFSYKANDGLIDSDAATVTITVKSVNDAPTLAGVPAAETLNELETLSLTPAASDIDSPAGSLRFSLTGAPDGMTINPATGALRWAPSEAQGPGTFNFRIKVSDGEASASAPVNVSVREINSTPALALISDQTIDELKTFSLTPKASDPDLPANSLTYSLDSGAPAGMTINPKTGEIAWSPTEAQAPQDHSITVRLTDNGTPSLSAARTFKLRANEVNAAPVFTPIGGKTVDEEKPLTFKAAAIDPDLPANTLSYSIVNAPVGAVMNPTTGEFSWTPGEDQGAGTYSVTFRVTDNASQALSDLETITITVNEVNKPPVADDAAVNTDEDLPVSIALKATDADLPLNTLKFSIVTSPLSGTLNGSAPNLTYQPKADFNGSDSFTFKVNDGSADSRTVTVTISVKAVNDSPTAAPDSAATEENVSLTINVIANDTDVDGDKLVLTNVANSVNGKAEISGGEVRFTPEPGFKGTAGFSYTVSDGKGGTATGQVTIKVNPAKQN